MAGESSAAQTDLHARACVNWAFQQAKVQGMGPEYFSGLLNGIRMGIALAHEDLAWAKAAYHELSAHVEDSQAVPVEEGTRASGQEQNLAFWRQAHSIINSTRAADGEGRR